MRGLCKFSGCVRIPDCLFLSDNLLESINRLLRSHNDPHGFHFKHDSVLIKLLCRYCASMPRGIWTNRILAHSLFAYMSTFTAMRSPFTMKTRSGTTASCCTNMYVWMHLFDILYLFRFGRHTCCAGRVLDGGLTAHSHASMLCAVLPDQPCLL